MKALKPYTIIVFFLVILIIGCKSQATIYLSGGKEAINAKIYLDGTFVGNMKEVITDSLQGALATIVTENGRHHIKIVSINGLEFYKEIDVQGENYVGIIFQDSSNIQ